MPRRRLLLALAVALLLCVAAPADAAAMQAQWPMDQANGKVVDTLGNADLTLTGPWSPVAGAIGGGIRFDYRFGPSLGTAANSTGMSPGTDEFAVAVYLKTDTVPSSSSYSPNIVQKGLYGDTGQWKMQLKGATSGTTAQCRFRGTHGTNMVNDSTATRLNDGGWHKITCWRGAVSYGITVDGATTIVAGTVGSITNRRPIRVGSKTTSAGVTDQFQGTVDCLAYQVGSLAKASVEARVPC